METEQILDKNLMLLVWNGKRGKFEKFILNPALKQLVDGEHHLIAGMRVGEL